jgi:hypothetical protein
MLRDADPDPRQPNECGSKWTRIRIHNTGKKRNFNVSKSLMFSLESWRFVQEFGNPVFIIQSNNVIPII